MYRGEIGIIDIIVATDFIPSSMGCRYAQGYFYHRPAPAAAFLEIP